MILYSTEREIPAEKNMLLNSNSLQNCQHFKAQDSTGFRDINPPTSLRF